MAQKVQLKKNIRLEDITVEVPSCPGCGHEHELRVTRPTTQRACSYQKGTYIIEIQSGMFRLELSVKFTSSFEAPEDITSHVRVKVQGDYIS